jgi:hypothetical protein
VGVGLGPKGAPGTQAFAPIPLHHSAPVAGGDTGAGDGGGLDAGGGLDCELTPVVTYVVAEFTVEDVATGVFTAGVIFG